MGLFSDGSGPAEFDRDLGPFQAKYKDGVLHINWKKGIFVDTSYARMALDVGAELSVPHFTVVDIREIRGVDPKARRMFSRPSKNLRGVALITGSIFSRTIGNFFIFINRPQVPVQLVKNEKRAMDWIRAITSGTVSDVTSRDRTRVAEVMEVLYSYARRDFSLKGEVWNDGSELDEVITGINLLGEELKSFTVSRDYVGDLLDSVGDFLIVLNSNGNIRMVNKALSEALEISAEDVVGKPASMVLERGPMKEMRFDNAISTFEGSLVKGEDRIPVLISVGSVHSENGGKEEFILTAKDISEQKRLQSQVLHSAKLASIGELAAGVGHEINNPLAVIAGSLDVLKRITRKHGLEDKVIDKALDRQQKSIDRIANIVHGLRTYARVDTEHVDVINANQLVTETLGLVDDIFQKDGVRFQKEFDESQPCFRGNIGKFQQVLMNLVSNARDATEGQDERLVRVYTRTEPGVLKIGVEDNGCGIEERVRARIFDTFFTTKPAGKGTGLGLGIVANIVEQMEGRIGVESELGKGTCFEITLPRTAAAQKRVTRSQAEIKEKLYSGSVLVVEDETDIREMLCDALRRFGLEVDSASDGMEGWEKLNQKSYDCLFTDLKMPRMGGEKLIAKLREDVSLQSTAVVVITGGVATQYSREKLNRLRKNVDYYIKKPYSEKEIQRVLSEVFGQNSDQIAA